MKDLFKKRSTVVDIVAYSMRKYMDEGMSYSDVADAIIYDLEAMGMKPPNREKCPVLHIDRFTWEDESVPNCDS